MEDIRLCRLQLHFPDGDIYFGLAIAANRQCRHRGAASQAAGFKGMVLFELYIDGEDLPLIEGKHRYVGFANIQDRGGFS